MFLSVSTVFSRVSDGSSPVCFHILDWSALGVFVFFLDEEGSEHDLLTHKHTHTQACYANVCVSLHNNNAV